MTARPKCFSYIRISSPQQSLGHGIQRQMEASARWAEQNDMELVDRLEDIGVSAYKGSNVAEGALGKFLDAAREGKIPAGSTLVVENLDRISRQEIRKSLTLFLSILDLGIDIVTLGDNNRRYTAAKTELVDLVSSLVIMSRAHEESETKSQRLSAVWRNKRKNISTRKLTRMAPAWLTLSKDRSRFEVKEDRAAVVRTIFEECAGGIGCYSIARRLNERKVPTFRGRKGGWHLFVVRKLLSNRAVLGAFQPCRRVDGRQVPDGDEVDSYYPAIVDESLFYRAQDALDQRRTGGAGRRGSGISSLFTGAGILKCAYCNGHVKFENKGRTPRGGSYLVCDAAGRGLGCAATRWRYDEFEKSFLSFVSELDLESVIHIEDEARRRSILEDIITALRGELTNIKEQQERMLELVNISGTELRPVAKKLQELEARHAAIEDELHGREQERARLEVIKDPGMEEIKGLVARIQDGAGGDEVYKLRSRLALRIRSLVTMILVAPEGHAPLIRRAIASEPGTPDVDHEAYHRRYFGVGFRDGTVRIVIPDRDDPMRFEVQVVGARGGADGTVIDPDQEDPLRFDLS